jgi:hypothetical protein
MSTAQPLEQPSVKLDMSTAVPIDAPPPQGAAIQPITRATNPKLNIAASGENMPEYVGAVGAAGAALMAGEVASPALIPVARVATKWATTHPVVAAFGYHLARELGIPLPKILDVMSKFSASE